jgi:guanine deaminase
MCLAAIYWADIRTVFYAGSRVLAEKAGFMDRRLYREMELPPEAREVESRHLEVDNMNELMKDWEDQEGKVLY